MRHDRGTCAPLPHFEAWTPQRLDRMLLDRLSRFSAMPLVALPFLAASTASAVTLSNIDVVGGKSLDIEQIRRSTDLVIGKLYDNNDPAFFAACRNVRRGFPSANVTCNLILRANDEATYSIAIQTSVYRPIYSESCVDGLVIPKAVDARLKALDRAREKIFREKNGPADGREFIGADGLLDYASPRLHDERNRLVSAARKELQAIVDATTSCDVDVKVAALVLLQYSGSATSASKIALREARHPDPAVRNISLRLISTFSAALSVADRNEAAGIACEAILQGSFLDINKSLAVIDALEAQNGPNALEVGSACEKEIARLSTQSDSPQIGGFAKSIVRQRRDKASRHVGNVQNASYYSWGAVGTPAVESLAELAARALARNFLSADVIKLIPAARPEGKLYLLCVLRKIAPRDYGKAKALAALTNETRVSTFTGNVMTTESASAVLLQIEASNCGALSWAVSKGSDK